MRVDSGLFYNSAMLSKKCYFTFTFFPLLSVRVRVHAISAGLLPEYVHCPLLVHAEYHNLCYSSTLSDHICHNLALSDHSC